MVLSADIFGESLAGAALTAALAIALVAVYFVSRSWRLREKRHRQELRDYIDLTAAMVVVIGVDGIVRDVNRRTCDTLGYRRDELLGVAWIERMVAPAERAIASERLAVAGDPESNRGLRRRTLLCKDGTELLVEWEFAVRRDKDGTPVAYLASGHDVTAIEAHAHQLRELRELAQAVAATDDARAAVVEHALKITDAAWAVILEDGVVTAAAPGEPAELDLATVVAMLGNASGPTVVGTHWYEPIPVGGVVDAVLALGFDHDARLADEDLLGLLAGEAGVALRRVRSVQSLEEAALRDPLTDVANRRAFDIELPRALARARRSGKPLALASLDLNAFKPLNDTEGHEAGDRMLRACADAWLTELRGTDLLARIGGDEFSVILPDCGAEHVPIVRRRLRDACPHGAGAGVGIVIWDGTEAAESLMRRSDAALYRDKNAPLGRPLDDAERLAAVRATGLLDKQPDPILDEMTRVAQWLLDVPTVVLSVLTAEEQVYASQCGIVGPPADNRGLPVELSLCQFPVQMGHAVVTPDAREDDKLKHVPGVTELGAIAYAGVPLFSTAGLPIGVLCVADDKPREWTADELGTLRSMAARAETELQGRSVTSVT